MIKYEDYKLPCVEQGSFTEGPATIRTQFDYAIRQRRGRQPYPQASFSIVIKNASELDEWGKFWADLDMGVDTFLTDAKFGPWLKLGKKVRFVGGYQMHQLAKEIYRITATWEMADPKGDAVSSCTLYPADSLHPENKLYPNKCPQP